MTFSIALPSRSARAYLQCCLVGTTGELERRAVLEHGLRTVEFAALAFGDFITREFIPGRRKQFDRSSKGLSRVRSARG